MIDPEGKVAKCFGPLCKEKINKSKSWAKFCSAGCKFKYHMIKKTLITCLSLLRKEAALDMLENLRRRIERLDK